MPIITPATEGPSTRLRFSDNWPRTIALDTNSGSITSAVSAIRAGPVPANPIACRAEAAISIQNRMKSNSTASAIHNDDVNSTAWDTNRMERFENRSAATPPSGVAMSDATPKPSVTAPSPRLVPVSTRASQPRAMTWANVARKAMKPAVHRRR